MPYMNDTLGDVGWVCSKCSHYVKDEEAHVCPNAEIKVSQLTPHLLPALDDETKATLKSIHYAIDGLKDTVEDLIEKLQDLIDRIDIVEGFEDE